MPPATVAQVVEEDAFITFGLGGSRDVTAWFIRFHGFCHGFGEGPGFLPWGRLDRQHNVQTVAAGGLEEGLEFDAFKPVPHIASGCDDVLPARAGPRVEIEDQPVGTFTIVYGRAACVDLEHASLDQGDHAIEIVDRNNLVVFFRNKMKMFGWDASAHVLLKEALAHSAFRAAHERDRPPDQMRPHPFPRLHIKIGKVVFGDADIAPIDAVGVREAHIRHADVSLLDRDASLHA